MQNRNIIISGASGMDGSILCDQLLAKDNTVIGLVRRCSVDNLINLIKARKHKNFILEEWDITDPISVFHIVHKYEPRWFFNTAAQSHVQTSFSQPGYTFDVNTKGVLNILEAIRLYSPQTRLLNCQTSEQFGNNRDMDGFQRETTGFDPQSPYAVSKVAAHNLCKLYREAYGLFVSCSICFNHSGTRRGFNFITRKISRYIAKLVVDPQYISPLLIGNLTASRDVGLASEYTQGMIQILAHNKPDDFVLATGHTYTVRQMLEIAFNSVDKDYLQYIQVDVTQKRPAEVNYLKGDPSKANYTLGWKSKTDFSTLICQMIDNDIDLISKGK